MIRLPLSFVSPAGSRGRLSILIFHRVLARPDPLLPDLPHVEVFEAQMRWLREWFNVLPLGLAITRLYEGSLPRRAAAITFDDGYADNEAIAAPLLQRLGLTATFFVSSGFGEGGCMWNDRVIEAVRVCRGDRLDLCGIGLRNYPLATVDDRRRAAIQLVLDVKHVDAAQRQVMVDAIAAAAGANAPLDLMMRPPQLRRLVAMGMEVGAHTVSHPILARLASDEARDEIVNSRRQLEQLLDRRVGLFAYPNGHPHHDYGAEHVRMVREAGFDAAVTTAPGVSSRSSDRFQLPRFAPWDRTRLRYGLRLLRNFGQVEETVAAQPS